MFRLPTILIVVALCMQMNVGFQNSQARTVENENQKAALKEFNEYLSEMHKGMLDSLDGASMFFFSIFFGDIENDYSIVVYSSDWPKDQSVSVIFDKLQSAPIKYIGSLYYDESSDTYVKSDDALDWMDETIGDTVGFYITLDNDGQNPWIYIPEDNEFFNYRGKYVIDFISKPEALTDITEDGSLIIVWYGDKSGIYFIEGISKSDFINCINWDGIKEYDAELRPGLE